MATLFSSLLITAPPGAHSLHLARGRGPTGRGITLGIAPEMSEAKPSLPVLKDIWENLESELTIFSEWTHVPRSDLKDRLIIKQNSRKELLLPPAFAKREGDDQSEPNVGRKDSSVVFVAVFCSLMGTLLLVLVLVLSFVAWREACEVSQRKRRTRGDSRRLPDPLPLVEDSAYTAYPRDDSPSNFPPAYSQFVFEEKYSEPNDVTSLNTRTATQYPPRPAVPVHSGSGHRRSRGILRTNRRQPKKVVRLQFPPASPEPSIGKRYTQYDVTDVEQRRMPANGRAYRY